MIQPPTLARLLPLLALTALACAATGQVAAERHDVEAGPAAEVAEAPAAPKDVAGPTCPHSTAADAECGRAAGAPPPFAPDPDDRVVGIIELRVSGTDQPERRGTVGVVPDLGFGGLTAPLAGGEPIEVKFRLVTLADGYGLALLAGTGEELPLSEDSVPAPEPISVGETLTFEVREGLNVEATLAELPTQGELKRRRSESP